MTMNLQVLIGKLNLLLHWICYDHLKKFLITSRVSLEVKSNFQNDLLNVPTRRNNLSVSACIPPSGDNFKLNCDGCGSTFR